LLSLEVDVLPAQSAKLSISCSGLKAKANRDLVPQTMAFIAAATRFEKQSDLLPIQHLLRVATRLFSGPETPRARYPQVYGGILSDITYLERKSNDAFHWGEAVTHKAGVGVAVLSTVALACFL
jgi:hypothetical protein